MDNVKEIWKDLLHYEGLYQVSNLGNIWSIKRQRKMNITDNGKGYKQVHLTTKNGKHVHEYVHRLVALTFLENENGYTEVNHIDENKANNRVSNLEWCDRYYNCNYGSRNEYKPRKTTKRHWKEENGKRIWY